MIKKTCLAVLACMGTISLWANPRLPRLFGDHMVIQRERPVAIWGWAEAGEKITVLFHNQSKTTKAGKNGQWQLHLDPETAGGPWQLTVKGKSQLVFSQVMVGEVWICSGQSNMQMPIAGWGRIDNYQQEIADASFPEIRQFKVPMYTAFTPQTDVPDGDWKPCSPATAGDFSAAAYFFARALYRKLHIPVGLINTSWGGTHIETWTSRGAFEQSPEFKDMIAGLPPADGLSAGAAKKKEELLGAINTLQGGLPPGGEEAAYRSADYPEVKWASVTLPGMWEQIKGLENLDGIVWFRKTFDVSAQDAGKAATIDLGKIDDADETYLNGTKIGSMKEYSILRHYSIPAGLLKAGRNTIAIRVEDTGGGGGVGGDPPDLHYTITGGTPVSLAGDWSMKIVSVSVSASVGPNSAPTLLFNAMIAPLVPYTIRGAIWYQGEANAGRAYQYRTAFPLMINDWRKAWGEGDFPFYFVQLASWKASGGTSEHGSSWAELREAQAMTLSLPNTGMAITTDIGNTQDIHPKNKQEVGARLAAIALSNTYGQGGEWSGPVYQSMNAEGDKIVIHFTHTGSGLTVRDKYGYLKGFEIAGADHRFHYAQASIDGDKVVVWQDGVTSPSAVRYSWSDDPNDSNLFNKDGFPAPPFRTDNWPGITESQKFTVSK